MNTDKYDELINNKQFLPETFDGLMNHKMIKIEKIFDIEKIINIKIATIVYFDLNIININFNKWMN